MKSRLLSALIRRRISSRVLFGLDEIGQLLAQMGKSAFQLVQVAEAFRVDASHQLESVGAAG